MPCFVDFLNVMSLLSFLISVPWVCLWCTIVAFPGQTCIHLQCAAKFNIYIIPTTCLGTDAHLTADPGVTSSISARSHTFMEIDHEIISTVILIPFAVSFKKGFCQLQTNACARST